MSQIPEGFVLNEDPAPVAKGEGAKLPPLPEGFVLDSAGDTGEAAAPQKSMTDVFLNETNIGSALKGIYEAITLPRRVYDGEVDPKSPEATGDVLGLAGLGIPAPPGGVLARGIAPKAAEAIATETPAIAPRAINPIIQQAERLSGEGAPVRVPTGIASDNPAVQATFQRGAQMPGASGIITKSIDDFVGDVATKTNEIAGKAAGRTVEEGLPTAQSTGAGIRTTLDDVVTKNEAARDSAIAAAETGSRNQIAAADAAAQAARQEFDGLIPQAQEGTRATIGDDLTDALRARTEFHRAEQDKPYTTLRQIINADAPIPLPRSLSETVQAIGSARAGAGFDPWPGGTQAIGRILGRGEASFSDLQRLRSHIGGMIDDWKPGGGFDKGDLKRIYGSLTDALKSTAQASAKGGAGKAALSAFEKAEANFGARADTIGELNAALRNGPESLVDRLIGYASERGTANFKKLQGLQKELPADAQEKVSRLAFQRLSRGADGAFSEATLVRNWANLSPEGRLSLFKGNAAKIDAAVRKLQATSSGAKATREIAEVALSAETKAAHAKAKATNAEYLRLLSQSDEQIANTMLRMASDGAGANATRLAQMVTTLGADNAKNLASLHIQNMGVGRNGEFSVAALSSSWNKLTPSGKAMLFPDLALRRSLEDLISISKRAAEAQAKFANSSKSGGAIGQVLAGGSLVANPIGTIASLLGANVAARALAKPATSKAVLGYARAVEVYAKRPTAAAAHSVEAASRRLVSVLGSEMGVKLEANWLLSDGSNNGQGATARPR